MNVEILEDEVSRAMQKACVGAMSPPEIRLLPSGCIIPTNYVTIAKKIRDFEVRKDDVWICTFPKCGTTWTQEMTWLLIHNIDFDTAKSLELYKRAPFLEFQGLFPIDIDVPDMIDAANNLPSPRVIKTHLHPGELPTQLFEVKPKIIYVHRNPKDAAVSYFHHFQLWNNYSGTLSEFMDAFLEDKHVFSPFWKHVLGYWKLRDSQNMLFNSFEEMKSDLPKVIKKTADFLGVSYTPEQEKELLNHLSFKSMKNNCMVNFESEIKEAGKENMAFMRKGEVGSWKQEMPEKFAELFGAWTQKNLADSDFPHYKK